MTDECDEMTRDELMARFQADWGRGGDITSRYSTEILRDACKSQSPFEYIGNLEYFIHKGWIDLDDLNERSEKLI